MTGRKPGKVALRSVWLAEWKRNRKLGSDASVEFLTPKYKSVKKAVCEGGGNWGEGDWVFGRHFYFLLRSAKRQGEREMGDCLFLRIVVFARFLAGADISPLLQLGIEHGPALRPWTGSGRNKDLVEGLGFMTRRSWLWGLGLRE